MSKEVMDNKQKLWMNASCQYKLKCQRAALCAVTHVTYSK